MKQGEKMNEENEQRAAAPPLAAEEKQQDLSDRQPAMNVPNPPEAVDLPQDAAMERRGQEQFKELMNFDLEQEVKKEPEDILRQDKEEVNVIGDNGEEEGPRKRDLEQPLEEGNPVQGQVEDVGVAGGQDKEEAKEKMREEYVQDARGEEVVDERREQDEARKVRELKAMTDGS